MRNVDETGALVILFYWREFISPCTKNWWDEVTYQHLLPFIIQPSPLSALVTLVRMDTTSDPALGSDMAKDPMCSPVRRGGRYLLNCSSAGVE